MDSLLGAKNGGTATRIPRNISIFAKAKLAGAQFFDAFMKHDLMTLAAALAFYTVLALAPLLLITLSVVGLLFSASGVFAQLQSSLNVIWQSTGTATTGAWLWIRKPLLSMGMVLILGFLALVSLLVSTVLSAVFTQNVAIWQLVNLLISAGIFAAMFSLIFKYLPEARMTWKNAWVGGGGYCCSFYCW